MTGRLPTRADYGGDRDDAHVLRLAMAYAYSKGVMPDPFGRLSAPVYAVGEEDKPLPLSQHATAKAAALLQAIDADFADSQTPE